MNQNQNRPMNSSYRYARGVFWPIILIGAGIIFLLANTGVLTINPLVVLWKLWPVILIAIGLDILLGRMGGVLGKLVSALLGLVVVGAAIGLLFYAQANPGIIASSPIFGSSTLITEHISQPLGNTKKANVTLGYPSGDGSLDGQAGSANLIEGDITHAGTLVNTMTTSGDTARVEVRNDTNGENFASLFQPQRWEISLNPGVSYDLNLNQGSGSDTYDLSKLTLTSLSLNQGSGHSDITLPSTGQYTFQINMGSGSMNIDLPQGLNVQVNYQVGSGNLNVSNLEQTNKQGNNGVYQSANFSQSGPYVIINLQMGSGTINIR
jgi:hypothetical protein